MAGTTVQGALAGAREAVVFPCCSRAPAPATRTPGLPEQVREQGINTTKDQADSDPPLRHTDTPHLGTRALGFNLKTETPEGKRATG